MMKELQFINQAVYLKGFKDGSEFGFGYGYINGVDDLLSQIGKEASAKLRDEHNGHPMAFYKFFKNKYQL